MQTTNCKPKVRTIWRYECLNEGFQLCKPPNFDKLLCPNHFSYKILWHTPGKTMSISFIWHLVFLNLATSAPVVTSWKKWPHVVKSKYEEIFPVLSYAMLHFLSYFLSKTRIAMALSYFGSPEKLPYANITDYGIPLCIARNIPPSWPASNVPNASLPNKLVD